VARSPSGHATDANPDLRVRLLSFASRPENTPEGLAQLFLDLVRRQAGDRCHVGLDMVDAWSEKSSVLVSARRGPQAPAAAARAITAWLHDVAGDWRTTERLRRNARYPRRRRAALRDGSSLWIPLREGTRTVVGGLHLHTSDTVDWSDSLIAELVALAECGLPSFHRAVLVQRLAEAGCTTVPLGSSDSFLRFEGQIRRTARHAGGTVLITGERGTGKELAAWSLHCQSPRWHHPFVPVLVSALPETLSTAELFGHERGSFTGASESRLGRFMAADGGTLFLDEVADMSLAVQSILLRVVERGEVMPVGRDLPRQVDVRVVAATNLDLRRKVDDGSFRADFHDRLRVLEIRVPPLRERTADIPLLVNHFLRQFCRQLSRDRVLRIDLDCDRCHSRSEFPCATPAFYRALESYHWPGNVRELRNVVLQVLASAPDDVLDARHLPARIRRRQGSHEDAPGTGDPSLALDAVLRRHIEHVLALTDHNMSAAARLLEIPDSTLRSKVRKLGIRSSGSQRAGAGRPAPEARP